MADSEQARRAARWAGFSLDDRGLDLLLSYAEWLEAEAIPAGGLGPREGPRLWSRHIVDSLTFAAGWRDLAAPLEVLDVGSGVGLPGIPLAILWPDTVVTLLDRGGRRIRLLRRAVRMLALPNVVVAQGDGLAVADSWHGMVFRGSLPPPEAVGLASRVLDSGGRAVLGLSRREEPPERTRDLLGIAGAMGLDAVVERVPTDILDGPGWLLIMARNDPES